MKNSLPTEAGPINRESPNTDRTAQIDAISQVFSLFRLNYHAQFFKAFNNDAELVQVKKLWLSELSRFQANTLLQAAKVILETSDYLPTLHTMIRHCEALAHRALPDAHTAYIEACRAPSPKAHYRWSHPLVYHAGKASDWYFLQTSSESAAFPVFRKKYQELVERLHAGERFTLPSHNAIEETPSAPLSKDENQARLKSLRDALDL